MNILFVHETDYIDKVVYEWHCLAEGLSLRGHNVYVIDYPHKWHKDTKHNVEIKNLFRAVVFGKVTLIRPYFIKIPILSRISAFFTHFWVIRNVIKYKNIDAIILYSVATNAMQAIFWARIFKIPIIFRSIDILHRMVKNPILRQLVKICELDVYNDVDLVLANTPNYANYVKSYGAKNVKVLNLPVDTNLFRTEFRSRFLMQKWGIHPNDKVIVFMGTLFDFCGIKEFIQKAFPYIFDKCPSVKFLVVGGGKNLESLKLECNYSWVIFTGYQSYNLVPDYINLADVCVNTFKPSKQTNDIFPGKIIQYLACGKPVVSTRLKGIECLNPVMTKFVDNYEIMAREVVDYIAYTEGYKDYISNIATKWVRDNFDQKKIVKQLEDEIGVLISKR